MSRHSIRLHRSGGLGKDLGSKNGTFVRGARLTGPAPLADGETFRLGDERLTLRVYAGSPTDTSDGASRG